MLVGLYGYSPAISHNNESCPRKWVNPSHYDGRPRRASLRSLTQPSVALSPGPLFVGPYTGRLADLRTPARTDRSCPESRTPPSSNGGSGSRLSVASPPGASRQPCQLLPAAVSGHPCEFIQYGINIVFEGFPIVFGLLWSEVADYATTWVGRGTH